MLPFFLAHVQTINLFVSQTGLSPRALSCSLSCVSSPLSPIGQGLNGVRSPLPINGDLESDTWYQVSAVSERAEGVYSQPAYAVAKTHREPARVLDWKATPVHGSTDSLSLLIRLDCSSAPTHEACGILRCGENVGATERKAMVLD